MDRVRNIDLNSIVDQLPDIQKFNPRAGPAYGPDSLFLCALGFEPRCLTLPRLLAESGYRSERVVVFEYDTNVDENERNRKELTQCLEKISDNIQPLFLSKPDYTNDLRDILNSLSTGHLGNRATDYFRSQCCSESDRGQDRGRLM